MNKNILMYNNPTEVMKLMQPLFRGEGYDMLVVSELEEIELRETSAIKLLLTDNELDFIRYIRSLSNMPIIVLSGKADEWSKIAALDAGADDYVVHPCNPLELLARIKCQIRRYTQLSTYCNNTGNIYTVKGLVVNDVQRKVTVEGREVRLTPIEYKILRLLMQEKGRVLSNGQIYESIWHMDAMGADNTVAVHIRHIREKIEKNPKEPEYLKVVWGTGYKVG
ncbi:MAG: response regulator transcription factor [Lachnospiraceae bacterium]|nr:response regulator transcription factor [Lachnospiraceae bacterium]